MCTKKLMNLNLNAKTLDYCNLYIANIGINIKTTSESFYHCDAISVVSTAFYSGYKNTTLATKSH